MVFAIIVVLYLRLYDPISHKSKERHNSLARSHSIRKIGTVVKWGGRIFRQLLPTSLVTQRFPIPPFDLW